MDVAKRLDFDPTDTLPGLQDGRQFQSANLAALQELQQAVQDLTAATKQKQGHIVALAQQTAEQGIGDNDLKRLQRQFDSNKSTFINVDQKQRFMKGLWDFELDIEQLTAVKDEHEQQLEKGSDALRRIKAQNEQARQQVAGTCQQVSQLYSLVGQATEATGAQLEATHLVLQQAAAKQPLTPPEPPLEPGPGQEEVQQLIEAETAAAKELERRIAAMEAALAELHAQAVTDKQELAALTAGVQHMEVLLASRTLAADTDKHVKDATAWCEQVMAMVANTTGLSVEDVSSSQLTLNITVRVPTSRRSSSGSGSSSSSSSSSDGKPPLREVQHKLVLTLQPSGGGAPQGHDGSSAGGSSSSSSRVMLLGAKLSPSCVEMLDLAEAAAGMKCSATGAAYLVREVRGRLLSYWRRKVLVEAALEVFTPVVARSGPPHLRAALGNQVEVEVLVPFSWPSDADELLRVVQLSAPGLQAEAAERLMATTNADAAFMARCDVLGLLQRMAEVVGQQALGDDAATA